MGLLHSGITEQKIGVLQEVPLSLFLTVFNEFKVKNCVFLNLLFLFYLRSLPLDVCIYTFGSRTKISAPTQASPQAASFYMFRFYFLLFFAAFAAKD